MKMSMEDLVSRRHDNVFDTNHNVMIHYPKRRAHRLNNGETVFTSIRHLTAPGKYILQAVVCIGNQRLRQMC